MNEQGEVLAWQLCNMYVHNTVRIIHRNIYFKHIKLLKNENTMPLFIYLRK